jgi:hypothetical protein
MDHQRVLRERGTRALGPESTSAELDDRERPAREKLESSLLLALPEPGFTLPLEELRDRRAGSILDDGIDRDEPPSQPFG